MLISPILGHRDGMRLATKEMFDRLLYMLVEVNIELIVTPNIFTLSVIFINTYLYINTYFYAIF